MGVVLSQPHMKIGFSNVGSLSVCVWMGISGFVRHRSVPGEYVSPRNRAQNTQRQFFKPDLPVLWTYLFGNE
jgi:hypothetical protein